MDRRLAVGLGVGAGAALLVAGVGSAGLVGLSGTPAGVVVTSTPTPLQSPPSAGPTPTPRRVDPVPADVLLAETVLDPAALPVRRPDRAAVVVQAYDSTGDIALLAFDADEAEWVRVELPGRSRLGQIRLSPDGRAILRPVDRPSAPGAIEVVDLATGVTRPVPVPVPQGRVAEDCWGDAAWASSGRVGIVSGCLVPTTATGAGPAYVGMDTWVHEVDLATGGARVVEHVADSAPLESYPAYSPDGRFLAYGIGYGHREGDEDWATLRVTQVDGLGAQERDMTQMVLGDPWADSDTVLGGDALAELGAPDAYLLVDARTGGTAPLGVEGLTNLRGFVGGRLVLDGTLTPREPTAVALWVADVASGDVRPWLAVPDGIAVGAVSVAADLVTP